MQSIKSINWSSTWLLLGTTIDSVDKRFFCIVVVYYSPLGYYFNSFSYAFVLNYLHVFNMQIFNN